MLESALGILVSAVVALIIAFPLGSALKKCPWAFYAAALVLVLGYTALRELFPRNDLVQAAMPLFQKGYVSVWLLAVVMWTGVLDEGTALRKRLQPIRGELSILSFIFILALLPCRAQPHVGAGLEASAALLLCHGRPGLCARGVRARPVGVCRWLQRLDAERDRLRCGNRRLRRSACSEVASRCETP